MLQPDTLNFLKALKENNNRDWFADNKAWYERAKADFEATVVQLIAKIATFDKAAGQADPKKCIFRIYRDVRFSQDKSPYKQHFGASFRRASQDKTAGYYLHIEPGNSFVACGLFMPPSDQIKKIRKGIYDDFDTLHSIVSNKDFKKTFGDLSRENGQVLVRVPNGFDKDHPSAEYLKLKSFYVYKDIADKDVTDSKFVQHAGDLFKLTLPLNDFLCDLLSE